MIQKLDKMDKSENQISDIETMLRHIKENGKQQSTGFISNRIALLDNISFEKFQNYNRVNMFTFALCTAGRCNVNINFREYEAEAGSLFITMPNQFFQIKECSEDCNGKVIVLANEVAEESMVKVADMLDLFFYVRNNPKVQLSKKEVDMILQYDESLSPKMKDHDNFYSEEISRHLLIALFFDMCNIYKHKLLNEKTPKSRQDVIFEQFFYDLSLHFKQEHGTEYYASKIGITPKYLSAISMKVSGQFASDWIHEFLIAEAKVLLKSTDMTMMEISNELSFPNQSYFGRFFLKHTGETPRSYRFKTSQTNG